MRQMGYPSHEVLAAWIDELAPGERVIRRGPVADKVRRMAVARLAAGGVTSREVAAEVGVEASVVRNWKRQLLHEPVPEDVPVRPDEPRKRDGGVADLDALDLAGLIAERDRAYAELERIRREKREMEMGVRHHHEHRGAAPAGIGAGDLLGHAPRRHPRARPPQRPRLPVHKPRVHH